MSLAASIEELSPAFSGQLLQPTDAGYDEARRLHNGLIDKRPALIARCRGTADVADAVKLGRTLNLEIAVRGGGHNVGGRGTVANGLMIDLALMKGIHVDPKTRTARAQGGVLWREFNRETQLHALATTGGVVGSTGIAGLTLGGGIGWLMPKYALALDNLRSAEMVMADGQALCVSADENADLFWAIRGGGGNFGIACSLEYQLHQVGPIIAGGLVAHPLASGPDVFRMFRDQCQASPDEQMLVAGMLHAPDGSGAKLVAVVGSHCGPLAEGEKSLAPVKKFGSPVMDAMGPISYCGQNGLFDSSLPRGAFNYWKSQFLVDLSDEAIGALVEIYQAAPSPMCQVVVEHFHGAASRVPVNETATALRTTGFNVVIIGQWLDHTMTDRCTAWCRDAYATLKPFMRAMRYMNYMDADDMDDPNASVYGVNYPRLREIKRKYDPDNVFHINVNVKP
jgi:FAD/FMN-containing dehydrogenase